MSGLNNTRPHYVFRHLLSADGFDRWMKYGLGHGCDFEVDRMFMVELGDMVSGRSENDRVIVLDEVGAKIWCGIKSELWFRGTLSEIVAGEHVRMNVTGYISPKGMGVMWVEDGERLLDDLNM